MSTEVELKLAARPADLPALKRALGAMSQGAVSSQEKLISTYYDTPDLRLRRSGLSSRPEEFHLRALPEPCVTLSSHTAPDVRPLP